MDTADRTMDIRHIIPIIAATAVITRVIATTTANASSVARAGTITATGCGGTRAARDTLAMAILDIGGMMDSSDTGAIDHTAVTSTAEVITGTSATDNGKQQSTNTISYSEH